MDFRITDKELNRQPAFMKYWPEVGVQLDSISLTDFYTASESLRIKVLYNRLTEY